MSHGEWVNGIRLNYGCKHIIFRDAREIKVSKHQIKFLTAVVCLGNNKDSQGNRVYTQLNPSTYAGLENCILNPILIRYDWVDKDTTKVTVHLEHLDSFEVIVGG